MVDIVTIGYRIQTGGAKEAHAELSKVFNDLEKIDKKQSKVKVDSKPLDEVARASAKATKELSVLQKQKENLEKGFGKSLSLSMARMQVAGVPASTIASYAATRKQVDDLAGSMNKIRISSNGGIQAISAFGVSLGTVISFGIAKQVLELADNFNLLQAKIKLVTPANVSLTEVTKSLVDIANSNFLTVQDTINLYTKLVPAIKQVGGGYRDALGVSDAFAKALRVGGANAREASAATIQFAQALGSGKLAGDRQICHPVK